MLFLLHYIYLITSVTSYFTDYILHHHAQLVSDCNFYWSNILTPCLYFYSSMTFEYF